MPGYTHEECRSGRCTRNSSPVRGGRIVRADVGLVEPASRTPVWDEYKDRVNVEANRYVEVDVLDI